MWRITSIIDLDRGHDVDKLLLSINTGNYAVLFYDTVTKVSEEIFIELGVVQLSKESVIAQCFTKLQLDIIKCIKNIKRDKIRYNFGSYPDLAY